MEQLTVQYTKKGFLHQIGFDRWKNYFIPRPFITRHSKWIILNATALLLFFTAYRLFIFYKFNSTNAPLLGRMLWLGFRFDIRSIFVTLLPMFLLTGFQRFSPFYNAGAKKFWKGYLLLAYILVFIFFISDYQYFSYRNVRLGADILELAKDTKTGFQMVVQSYPVVSILLIFSIALYLSYKIINSIMSTAHSFTPMQIKPVRVLGNIVFFLFMAIGIYGKLKQFPLRFSDAFDVTNDKKDKNNDFLGNIALNPIQNFFSTYKSRAENGYLDSVKQYFPVLSELYQLPNKDLNACSFERHEAAKNVGKKPNIVLVICESYAMYKSSMMENALNPTPYFNKLRKEGLFFTNCYSPAYGTARGVWAIITGTPDAAFKQASSRNPRSVNQHSIADEFEGYEKYYFLGGDASWANIRGLLKNNIRGLKIHEEPDYNSTRVDVWGISDRDLFKEATKVLNKETKPFFSIIQTSSNHRPFTIPKKDGEEMGLKKTSLDSLIKYGFNVDNNVVESNKEYNSVRYMDFSIEDFMKNAKNQPWFDNTIFLFVGDHGIRNWDIKYMPKVFVDKGITCQHVPMLVYGKGVTPQQIDFPVSQLDVLPTLAGYAGIPYKNTTLGRDLNKVIADTSLPRFSFILDHSREEFGYYFENMFYIQSLKGMGEDFQQVELNKPKGNKPIEYYRQRAHGIYQTSRYMLFNNKK